MEERWFMPCKADAASVNWVSGNEALAETVAGWGSVIALDTEFMRSDTFFPLPGLYQVNAGGRIFLLDPLTIDDWSGFVELLENPQVVVVMHACGEDLELMRHHMGAVPTSVFDTQVAHAFLSSNFSTSYAKLVSDLLDIDLDKHETRSDWRARPLSDEQIHYACEDVQYLPELYQQLLEGLRSTDRELWFNETMSVRGRFQPTDPDQHYQNNKRAWRLDGEDLAVLQRLTAWRERCAMAEDVPRKRVVWDEHLLEFAKLTELTEDAVRETVPRSIARRYTESLINEHQLGRQDEPLPKLAQPLSPQQSQVSKKLREVAKERALELGIAPELLARKRDVEACIRAYSATGQLSSEYQGWRADLLEEKFRRILETGA
jgi:ribonuclease D